MRGANPLLSKKDLVIEVLVERLHACALIGGTSGWRMAENLRPLWERVHDVELLRRKARHRLRAVLSKNDCHHVDSQCKVFRMIGSRF